MVASGKKIPEVQISSGQSEMQNFVQPRPLVINDDDLSRSVYANIDCDVSRDVRGNLFSLRLSAIHPNRVFEKANGKRHPPSKLMADLGAAAIDASVTLWWRWPILLSAASSSKDTAKLNRMVSEKTGAAADGLIAAQTEMIGSLPEL